MSCEFCAHAAEEVIKSAAKRTEASLFMTSVYTVAVVAWMLIPL
jgi:hypothetical protein